MIWRERTVEIEKFSRRVDWLSAGERDALRGDRGRACARLVAKQLLAESCTSVGHFSQIHIESRDGRDRATCPRVYISGQLAPWNVSLSHTDRMVSAAVLPACQGRIGIDLVDSASLAGNSLRYWLTSAETERAPDQLSLGFIWSLKEAIYKATNEGLPFFPRHVDTATYLSLAEWSRLDRDARIQGAATAAMHNGWELSLHVIEETIKTLVWFPAACGMRRVPA